MIKFLLSSILVTHISCSMLSKKEVDLDSEVSPLRKQISEIRQYISIPDKSNPEVSKWSSYNQIEHILIANNQIMDLIEKGEEPVEKKSRSFMSYVVLTFGYIPRRLAEAPKNVVPVGVPQAEIMELLQSYLSKLEKVKTLKNMDRSLKVGNHPYFGDLTSDEWIRFIEVHTNHHIKIIRDI